MYLAKLKKFMIDNYKLMIPIILILVVFLSFIIYYFISKTFVYKRTVTGSYYQYFSSEKVVYDIDVTKDKKGVITDIKPVSRYVEYDSTPIYDTKNDIVIFPSDMDVVITVMNMSEYLTKANSYVYFKNKRYSLVTNKFNSYLGHYFFYDGNDLYFFIENTVLHVGDRDIELSPYSYVIAKADSISYYDKLNDKFESISINGYDNYINSEYYKIYVNGDYVDYYGNRVTLTGNLEYLSDISQMKRITNE